MAPDPLRWANRFAGHIHDPVVRLRFLRAVVRLPDGTEPRRHFGTRHIFLILFLAAVCGLVMLARSAARRGSEGHSVSSAIRQAKQSDGLPHTNGQTEIWQVEKAADSETYSNGLRIDDRFEVSNRPRAYLAFPTGPGKQRLGIPRTEPAGIVFHTTESRQAPFEPGENGALRRIGESLLQYVREKKSYHFLIDRFGRVYRVVREGDVAYHAGYSVWSDDRWLYVNLNESFLGVAFEADTAPGQLEAAINPAQVRSAAALMDVLRSRYPIPPGNCVTHAQVSVNPSNMRIGYHTDWASSFPFEQLGLPDNYGRALPSLECFGFEYDPAFLHAGGARMFRGIELAERDLEARAAAEGLSVPAWRKRLQAEYRVMLARVRSSGCASESE